MNKAVEAACRQLLSEYCENPLWYLREANIQSRLNQLILAEFGAEHDTVMVKIASATGDFRQGKTKKSQLEMKLRHGAVRLGRSDIVILRDENVELTCAPSGALDITARIDVGHVEAIVEVKAAPSANGSIPPKLRTDIQKLFSTKDADARIEAHFFYLDKSLSLQGHRSESNIQPNDLWENDSDFEITEIVPSGPYPLVVYVWGMDPSGKQSQLRYAYRKPRV